MEGHHLQFYSLSFIFHLFDLYIFSWLFEFWDMMDRIIDFAMIIVSGPKSLQMFSFGTFFFFILLFWICFIIIAFCASKNGDLSKISKNNF